MRYVYLLKLVGEDTYKIGVSSDVNKRIKQLQTGNSNEIILVSKFKSEFPFKVESSLHRMYGYLNVNGEWYSLDDKQVESFQKNCEMFEKNFKTLSDYENPFFK